MTTRETLFFFFLVSSQVELLTISKELGSNRKYLNLSSWVKCQTAQSWHSKSLSFPFCTQALWLKDKLPEGLFLGSDMNYRLNLYTRTSKYTECKLQNVWEIWPSNFLPCIKAYNLNFKVFNNTTKRSLTSVTYINQNRFRGESSIMKLPGCQKQGKILLLAVASFVFKWFVFLSLGPSPTHIRPLCDVEKAPCSPLGRALLW